MEDYSDLPAAVLTGWLHSEAVWDCVCVSLFLSLFLMRSESKGEVFVYVICF